MKKNFKQMMLFILTIISLIMASCSKSEPDNGCGATFCEDILRPTPVKIRYVDNKGEDLLFSSMPSLSLGDLRIYTYLDGKEFPDSDGKAYSVHYTVEGENTKYLLVYGSVGNEGYFFIRFGNGSIDKIYFKGSLDPTQCCPQNKVDELYQNGTKSSIDKKTGIWKLVK